MLTVEVARSSALLMRRVTGDSSIRRTANVDRVRRVLFDEPLDHEQTRRDLINETEKMRSETRERWNFDFHTGTPLQGRYEWHRISPSEPVHPAYELRHLAPRLAVPTSSTVSVEPAKDSSSVSKTGNLQSAPLKAPVNSQAGTKIVQKKVTDFLTQRKRTLIKSSKPPSPTPKNKVRRTTTT